MNHRSLAFRLAAWYTLLLTVAFALVGVGTHYGMRHYLRSNLHDALARRAGQIERILADAPQGVHAADIAAEIESRLSPEFNSRFVRVTRAPDELVFRSGVPADRSFDPARVPQPDASWSRQLGVPAVADLDDVHVMLRTVLIDVPSGLYRVETGASSAPMQSVLDRLVSFLVLLLPLLLVCAAGGAFLLVGWALRPVDRLSQTAEQLSVQNLWLRLPVVRSGDALERLAISLNNMLGRLRDSVQASRRFLADASHELRTPLAVIKGELQEIAGGGRLTDEQMRERVGSVLEEVARLEHLVSGLLTLSRLDAGETPREKVDVNLAALARSTAEQMRLMAVDRGITIVLSELTATLVHGERGRLKQIIVNLLDNAIRFTPPGGTVTIRTLERGDAALLEVEDTGIGIPAFAIPQVFDRFFRVDQARSREDGGAGLGLSIVKSVCSMHGADIEVESQPGRGSCFRVKFPRRPTAADPEQKAAETEPGTQPESKFNPKLAEF